MAFIELLGGGAAERLGLPPGEVPNYAWLGRPPPRGLRRLAALIGAIRGGMDLRRYESQRRAAKDSVELLLARPRQRAGGAVLRP